MIVEEAVKEVFFLDMLNFNDDPLLLVFGKEVVATADKANGFRVFVFGMDLINVQLNTEDVLSKAGEDFGVAEHPFKGWAVFERDDINHGRSS